MAQPHRRTVRWLLAGLAAVALLALGHQRLLRGLGQVLVVDQRPAEVDYVWARSGDHCYDEAAGWYRDKRIRRILLIDRYHDRMVQWGAMPSHAAKGRRALQLHAVPSEAVQVIPGEARDDWEEVRLLESWLQQHPQTRVLVLCNRFSSRYCRYLLDSVLEPQARDRVWVTALPDRRFDESDWWKVRSGVRGLMYGYLRLFYAWCQGEERVVPERWSIEEFEQRLRQELSQDR